MYREACVKKGIYLTIHRYIRVFNVTKKNRNKNSQNKITELKPALLYAYFSYNSMNRLQHTHTHTHTHIHTHTHALYQKPFI